MIKNQSISDDDIKRISQFIIEDIQTEDEPDISELIRMYLEDIAGCELLSSDEIENLIITIESKVDELQQFAKGGQ